MQLYESQGVYPWATTAGGGGCVWTGSRVGNYANTVQASSYKVPSYQNALQGSGLLLLDIDNVCTCFSLAGAVLKGMATNKTLQNMLRLRAAVRLSVWFLIPSDESLLAGHYKRNCSKRYLVHGDEYWVVGKLHPFDGWTGSEIPRLVIDRWQGIIRLLVRIRDYGEYYSYQVHGVAEPLKLLEILVLCLSKGRNIRGLDIDLASNPRDALQLMPTINQLSGFDPLELRMQISIDVGRQILNPAGCNHRPVLKQGKRMYHDPGHPDAINGWRADNDLIVDEHGPSCWSHPVCEVVLTDEVLRYDNVWNDTDFELFNGFLKGLNPHGLDKLTVESGNCFEIQQSTIIQIWQHFGRFVNLRALTVHLRIGPGDEQILQLASSLENLKWLKALNLDNSGIMEDASEQSKFVFVRAIQGLTNLQIVSIRGNKLTEWDISQLIIYMPEQVSNLSFGSDGCCGNKHEHLAYIDTNSNYPLLSDGIQLGMALRSVANTQTLVLSGAQINDSHARQLGSSLSALNSMTHLDLGNNSICDTGLQYIVDELRRFPHSKLEVFYMDNQHFTYTGFQRPSISAISASVAANMRGALGLDCKFVVSMQSGLFGFEGHIDAYFDREGQRQLDLQLGDNMQCTSCGLVVPLKEIGSGNREFFIDCSCCQNCTAQQHTPRSVIEARTAATGITRQKYGQQLLPLQTASPWSSDDEGLGFRV